MRPWIDLEFGPQKEYPRLIIARPKQEDIKQLTESLGILVPLGLKVQQSEIRDKLGLSDPDAGGELLAPAPKESAAPIAAGAPAPTEAAGTPAVQSAQTPDAVVGKPSPSEAIAAELARSSAPGLEAVLASIEAMIASASDLSELRMMIQSGLPGVNVDALANEIGDALAAAHGAGRSAVADEAE